MKAIHLAVQPTGEQKLPLVAYQGARGSFSDQAVKQIWAGRAVAVPTRDFAATVQAVSTGDVNFAVLPVSNTFIGVIVESSAAIARAPDVTMVGEILLDIHHCLLARPGSSLESIRRVFSHPAALAQCAGFFSRNPAIAPIAAYDTAGAAEDVALRANAAEAAIAPREAAAEYGLSVLAADIHDDPRNATRFIIISAHHTDDHPASWQPLPFFRVRV